mgnify:CR=1 FL=1
MLLQTERLLLREMEKSDLPALRRILQDPEVMYAYEHAFTEDEVQAWFQKQRQNYSRYGYGLWAVVLRSTGEMIGQCGLTRQPWGDREVTEIGYLFAKAFWHNGYAAEAAIACKQYAFDVLGEREVFSIIRESNLPSQKVARRNGMQPCGRQIKRYYGMDMPHLVFSIQREE